MSLKYGELNPSPIQSVINNEEPPLLPNHICNRGISWNTNMFGFPTPGYKGC